jgi:gamma-D-glutamyl-L-lysine dipeptidyl-peptidase
MRLKDKIYCHLSVIPVRAENKDEAEIVTQLLFGETAEVLEEVQQWRKIRITHDGYEGWIDRKQGRVISDQMVTELQKKSFRLFDTTITVSSPWGPIQILKGAQLPNSSDSFSIGEDTFSILSTNRENKPKDIASIALSYINAPYLWGGRSPFGIDCSGFTQVALQQLGIQIARDASQQVLQGKFINYEDAQIGDLVFFENKKGNIHHVGLLLENTKIIHASGRIRIDLLTKEGILNTESETITHNFHSIRRFLH